MTIWGITDGSAGMRSQVEGVLEALLDCHSERSEESYPQQQRSLAFARDDMVIKTCRRRAPFAWLPIWLHWGALHTLTSESDALIAPWPDAVMTSGRRSAALALEIKRKSGGKTKLIHLTDPRACRAQFDLIVAMQHDAAEGENVLKTRFALHRITSQKLQDAAVAWREIFAAFPKPHVAVLMGGSTNKYTLDTVRTRSLIGMVKGLLRRIEGSLLITPSRRTGAANVALMQDAFAPERRVYFHSAQEANPYLGMLALADYIVVTNDSVNMLSEALATGKPVYLLPLPGHEHTKPATFAEALAQDGIVRWLDEQPLTSWEYTIPDEKAEVVRRVLAVLR